MELGEKMKKLRLEQGLTLEEVGNRVGVGKSTVRKWENGQIANMRRDKIALVAKALNTTPAYLMGWEDAEASPTDDEIIPEDELMQIREDMRRNPELRTLHSMARNVTRGEIKQIEAFIRAIRTSNDYDETDTP